jgi:hypothetical protein
MADNPIPPPEDALDIDSLWLDPKLGDGLVDVHPHKIPIDKPKDFFRVVKDPKYRRLTEIYTFKPEGQIEETHYLIAKSMRGRIEEARLCTLVTCVYRDGSVRLWPLKLPKDGERDNEAWVSARSAAKAAMEKWVKLVWVRRSYLTRDARPGYAPDPDCSKLLPFDEYVGLAVGAHGIIRDDQHRMYLDLFGAPPKKNENDGDDGLS